MKPISIFVLTMFVVIGGFSLSQAYGQILTNNVFFLEGSGFAVTEESIKESQIDFAIATGSKSGSSINAIIEDGFVTLNDEDYTVIDMKSTLLREGRYMRISGIAEGINGELTISFFGRLVEDSREGSIYGFTGRITHGETSHKIIYTAKLSQFSQITETTSPTQMEKENTIYIMPGSSTQGLISSYIEGGKALEEALKIQPSSDPLRIRYFSQDRLTIEPGTTVTIVNSDSVSHNIVSGAGLGTNSRITGTPTICEEDPSMIEGFRDLRSGSNQRQTNCDFTLDGRIDTGEIPPGESVQVTFEVAGFYRIIDPDYHWMQMVVYSFPQVDSLIIRSGDNPLN